jgi:hypothetical protein
MLSVEEVLGVIAPDVLLLANVDTRITMAQAETSASFFGDKYSLAVALRVAHTWALLTVRSGSETGAVTYKMEGRLAVSYGGTGVIRDEWELTNYGRQLKKLIQNTRVGITTTSEDVYNTFLAGA